MGPLEHIAQNILHGLIASNNHYVSISQVSGNKTIKYIVLSLICPHRNNFFESLKEVFHEKVMLRAGPKYIGAQVNSKLIKMTAVYCASQM